MTSPSIQNNNLHRAQSLDASSSIYHPKRKCWLSTSLIIIFLLAIGLITAITFAVIGANRTCSKPEQIAPQSESETDTCPSNPAAWQDLACCRKTCNRNWEPLPLLLISMDGFRSDYLRKNKTPSLKRLIECGVHAPFMYPSFPTKTFSNHYTIVTGLYAESHGIIDNSMYDEDILPDYERLFKKGSPSSKNPQWWFGEPFWNTVIKSGMKAASYFWPGSEISIQNMLPTYYTKYNKSIEFFIRVDQIVDWLLLPDQDVPAFLAMYMEQPDSDGHVYGPDSEQVMTALLHVDGQINYLLTRLFQADLLHCVNLVVVADHGMEKVSNVIYLDNYMKVDNFTTFGGAVARITLNESSAPAEEIRSGLTCKNKQYRVYLREDIPKRLHFSKILRIGDVVVDGDAGVQIFDRMRSWKRVKSGDHGYDNLFDAMRSLFVAWGPAYKQNYTTAPFQNIELYNFFADTLNIQKRAPNNGTLGTLDDAFIKPPSRDFLADNKLFLQACVTSSRSCGECTHKVALPCHTFWAEHANIFSPVTDQQQCVGIICNLMVVYNHDVRLVTVIVNMVDDIVILPSPPPVRPDSAKATGCTKNLYSGMRCEKINAFRNKIRPMKLTMRYLGVYSIDSGKDDVEIWDLQAPMHETFYNAVWQNLENLTVSYAQRFGQLIVLSGPVFDYDFDGNADDLETMKIGSLRKYGGKDTSVLIPTHFYRIFIKCSDHWTMPITNPVQSCTGELEHLVFILPNGPIDNCLDFNEYLRTNAGRIRDVELLIGVELFSADLSPEMLHKAVLFRTKMVHEIW